MTPRLPTSKKWTSLPTELCAQIREIFEEGFQGLAQSGNILVEGRIYPEELLLRIGHLENGRLKQANFEVSLDFNSSKQNAVERIHFAVDCAASMVQEYCDQEQDLEGFPRTWNSYKFDQQVAFLQVSTVNTSLESEADRLLGETVEDDLVHGSDDTDRKAIITMLGLEGSEDVPDLVEDQGAADGQEDLGERADQGSPKNPGGVKKTGTKKKNTTAAKKPSQRAGSKRTKH